VLLQGVRRVLEVLATDQPYQRAEQYEQRLGTHLELVLDPRPLALGAKREAVPTFILHGVRDDAHLARTIELLQLLIDLPETAQLPLDAAAFAELPGVEPSSGADRRVPRSEVATVDDHGEDRVDRRVDDLRPSDERHPQLASRARGLLAGR